MDRLISDLENLTAPDRIMDARIEISRRKFLFGAAAVAGIAASADMPGWIIDGSQQLIPAPFYCSSIDAALTLVPEEASSNFEVDLHQHKYRKRTYWEAVIGHVTFDAFDGEAPTAAIALCIAALKARARMEADQ